MINRKKIKKLECDIIVVGSGGSVSSSAQAAAEGCHDRRLWDAPGAHQCSSLFFSY